VRKEDEEKKKESNKRRSRRRRERRRRVRRSRSGGGREEEFIKMVNIVQYTAVWIYRRQYLYRTAGRQTGNDHVLRSASQKESRWQSFLTSLRSFVITYLYR
jgi:hypothetical protein